MFQDVKELGRPGLMSCSHPLVAVNLGKVDGKFKIKILPKRVDFSLLSIEEKYGSDNVLLLPCGCCLGCKQDHKRQYGLRCWLESSNYRHNCMVTLTYSDKFLVKKPCKNHLQDFIKTCRNHGIQFRYFGCGERGTKSGRSHYHLIMFGYWPDDARFEFNSEQGYPVYSSKFLSKIWPYGIVNISEVAPGTCGYVAGYVDKKIGNDDGFLLMSKRPGIGAYYFRSHLFDIFEYDNIVTAFGVTRPPRYADKIADQMFYDLDDLKAKRKKASNLALYQAMLDHGYERREEYLQEILWKNEMKEKKVRRQ